MSAPRPQDDWDRIEEWTNRVKRWTLLGLPTWVVLLAVLHENITGIPLAIGFGMACVLTLVIVVVDDARRRRRGAGLSPFGRAMLVWVGAYVVLAIAVSRAGSDGAAVVLIPFLGALLVTGVVMAVMSQRR